MGQGLAPRHKCCHAARRQGCATPQAHGTPRYHRVRTPRLCPSPDPNIPTQASHPMLSSRPLPTALSTLQPRLPETPPRYIPGSARLPQALPRPPPAHPGLPPTPFEAPTTPNPSPRPPPRPGPNTPSPNSPPGPSLPGHPRVLPASPGRPGPPPFPARPRRRPYSAGPALRPTPNGDPGPAVRPTPTATPTPTRSCGLPRTEAPARPGRPSSPAPGPLAPPYRGRPRGGGAGLQGTAESIAAPEPGGGGRGAARLHRGEPPPNPPPPYPTPLGVSGRGAAPHGGTRRPGLLLCPCFDPSPAPRRGTRGVSMVGDKEEPQSGGRGKTPRRSTVGDPTDGDKGGTSKGDTQGYPMEGDKGSAMEEHNGGPH